MIPDFELDSSGNPTDIPFVLFTVLGLEVTKRMLLLLVFASVLLLSFSSMVGLFGEFRPNKNFKKERPRTYFTTLIVVGLAIGVLTAFTGAGGGVLLVPLLVLVMGLPMKTVVGTSLAIMAGKSMLGFLGDVYAIPGQIEWGFLGLFSIVMIAGITVGSVLSNRVSGSRLKGMFAWFILAMAIFIFAKELIFTGSH